MNKNIKGRKNTFKVADSRMTFPKGRFTKVHSTSNIFSQQQSNMNLDIKIRVAYLDAMQKLERMNTAL